MWRRNAIAWMVEGGAGTAGADAGAAGAPGAAGADSGADPVPGRDVQASETPPDKPFSQQDDPAPNGAGAEAPGAGGEGEAAPDADAGTDTAPPADWIARLPAELKDNKLVQQYGEKGIEALVKDFVNQNAMIGKKGIIPPSENAGPEEIEAFHKALGRPEKVEGYEVKLPEGFKQTEETKSYQDKMVNAFFKAGLNQGAVDDLLEAHFEAVNEAAGGSIEDQAKAKTELDATIKEKWGQDEAANMDLARRGFVASGLSPEDSDKLSDLVGGNFALLEHMRAHGAMLQEDGQIPGRGGGGFSGGAAAALAELTKNREAADKDPEHPLRNRNHREHKAMVEKQAALYELAYPNEEPQA